SANYLDKVEIEIHQNLPEFLSKINTEKIYLVSKFSEVRYDKNDYSSTENDQYFIFGKESTGLPENFLRKFQSQTIRIPQNDNKVQSLNVSNAVAIVIYEVMRQQSFDGQDIVKTYPLDKLK
ncbi:MAG: tRNA (uridine(34)/cytosine(34)/5-carboxymethylaminomethyluridine(34)-2'-O)-methyltransferase TrmL, partial [Lactobacillaceae bacterium]|nr:tRNA (uridine(34)/cytosine(34)/5-carboxymethylaminomethyluridine(34)-2'-O)-methyltransferase TrmL [Lactobacillaceae bacterium]